MHIDWKYWQKNSGLALVALNVLFFIVLLLQQNPFALFKTGYEAASPLLAQVPAAEKIESIIISHPQYSNNVVSVKLSFISGDWQYGVIKKNEQENNEVVEQTQSGDATRVKDFLSSLDNTRRYIAIENNQNKAKEFELESDKNKSATGLTLDIRYRNGDSQTLLIGKVVGNEETYVRLLAEQEPIYLVSENLFEKSGAREPNFFRSRNLLAEDIDLRVIQIESINGAGVVKWSNSTGIWNQLYPTNQSGQPQALDQNKVDALANQMKFMKVQSFLEEIPTDVKPLQPMHRVIMNYSKAGNITNKYQLVFLVHARKPNAPEIYVEFVSEDKTSSFATINADIYNRLLDFRSFAENKQPQTTNPLPTN